MKLHKPERFAELDNTEIAKPRGSGAAFAHPARELRAHTQPRTKDPYEATVQRLVPVRDREGSSALSIELEVLVNPERT